MKYPSEEDLMLAKLSNVPYSFGSISNSNRGRFLDCLIKTKIISLESKSSAIVNHSFTFSYASGHPQYCGEGLRYLISNGNLYGLTESIIQRLLGVQPMASPAGKIFSLRLR